MAAHRTVSNRPEWSLPRVAYTSKRSFYHSENERAFGNYGSDPREKLNSNHAKQYNENDELSKGSTKVTQHIPGYNGYIPKTDLNSKAIAQSESQATRETIIKQNIVENQSLRVPGYQGHKPMSALNDRGFLRPNCLSTDGEKFS